MVFINEVLEQNRKKLEADKASVTPKVKAAATIRSRFVFDLEHAHRLLNERLKGQPEVVEQLLDALAFIKVDIADSQRPLWNALLLGPTGVGKTQSAKLLAQILTGNEDNLCRIDMNTLSQSHYSAAITGAPPGYVGSKEGVSLFDEALIEGDLARPGVVLFDEIEKASDEVRMALLSILEDGHLTLTGSGKSINFRNCVILMTSNLGARLWEGTQMGRLGKALGVQRSRQQRALQTITQSFSPEFYNRIDRVMMFDSLSSEAAHDILMLELNQLNRRLARKNCSLILSTEVCSHLVKMGFTARYGARSVRRLVRDSIEVPLARFLVDHANELNEASLLNLNGVWAQGKVQFTCQS
ncbi:AAA family ATPase [Gilvimarinus sp. 1_MG-2023]|uniref:AAA family ATPase n=1 Tax=Gilvimarinus sp. 1_MG-2023 TaxID=3062638 RepID=UPI0026E1BC6F|nr:AAA family ATPase [Gilvimarinus sp. 1_MG-2023]MDO6747895.1 AAA family ATPase [Gilvimarinus sp. 1_MG-2023]